MLQLHKQDTVWGIVVNSKLVKIIGITFMKILLVKTILKGNEQPKPNNSF